MAAWAGVHAGQGEQAGSKNETLLWSRVDEGRFLVWPEGALQGDTQICRGTIV